MAYICINCSIVLTFPYPDWHMSPKAKYTNTLYRTPTCTSNSEEPKVINSHVEQNKKKNLNTYKRTSLSKKKTHRLFGEGCCVTTLRLLLESNKLLHFFKLQSIHFHNTNLKLKLLICSKSMQTNSKDQ